jgi:hypothetical protein
MDGLTKKGRLQAFEFNRSKQFTTHADGYTLKFTLDFIQNASETQVHSRAFPLVCDTEGAE